MEVGAKANFEEVKGLVHLLLKIELLQVEYADKPDRLQAEVDKLLEGYRA